MKAPSATSDMKRERHNRLEAGQPQHHGGCAQRHDSAQRHQRRVARIRIGRAARQRVDQMSREHRHEQIGDGRPQ
ncbi:hypothetical protein ACVWXO_005121 [Bradyrhizobium sp. LM2.7]